jgi:hypothetical protein
MKNENNIKSSIQFIEESLNSAEGAIIDYYYSIRDNECDDILLESVSYYVKRAFICLLTLIENLELENLYLMAISEFKIAESKNFNDHAMGPDEPYIICVGEIYHFLYSIKSLYNIDGKKFISKDLISIIRLTVYSINDTDIY